MKDFHKEVQRQLDLLEKSLNGFKKSLRLDDMRLSLDGFFFFVRTDLSLHIMDEEKALFPVLMNSKSLEKDIEDIMNDHDYLITSVETLRLLKGMKRKAYSEIEDKVSEIIDTLREHVWKEENVVFRFAQDNLTGQQMSEIANKMEIFRNNQKQ
jgi:hemerythrin-like domain-containing protein